MTIRINFIALLVLSCAALTPARPLHIGTGQPYANIQDAAAASQPGDTIYVHAGTYAAYQYAANWHGAPNQWIVITRYKQDTIAIRGGWQFSSSSYLRFEHLTFRANAQFPGRLFHIDNGGSCATQSHHIDIDSCGFFDAADPQNSAFKFGGVDTFTVRRCHFQNGAAGAFDFNADHVGVISDNLIENFVTGGHIKGGASFITMERNTFLNASVSTWVAFELGGDTGTQFYCQGSTTEVTNLNFYSNVVIGGYRGLALSSAVNCNVVNNTFYSCGQATMRFLITSSTYPLEKGNIVANNLFVFGSASAYMNGGTQPADAASFANNIYYSIASPTFNGPYWDAELDSMKDRNPINLGSTTPMFIDSAAHDFHLADASPAIAAGATVTEPALDYYGNVFHAKRCIGAVEYHASTAQVSEAIITSSTLQVYPNPATTSLTIGLRDGTIKSVRIRNIMGQDVTPTVIQSSGSLDLSGLQAGVYFVTAATRERINVQRFTIMK